MSQARVADPAAFERAHYVRTVGTFNIADPRALERELEPVAPPTGPRSAWPTPPGD